VKLITTEGQARACSDKVALMSLNAVTPHQSGTLLKKQKAASVIATVHNNQFLRAPGVAAHPWEGMPISL
jgi:hypothetical protein